MSIVIPEDRYLYGAHKFVTYVDSNESVTTSGLSTYASLGQKGFAWGYATIWRASNIKYCYSFHFTNTAAQGSGLGGFISSSGLVFGGMSAASYGVLSEAGHFGTNIFLVDLYIDDANERIVMSWDSSSGTNTLDAQANFYVFKGSAV